MRIGLRRRIVDRDVNRTVDGRRVLRVHDGRCNVAITLWREARMLILVDVVGQRQRLRLWVFTFARRMELLTG